MICVHNYNYMFSFQGLYTLIVYVFLSWHTLTRKHKKYGIDDEVEPLTVPGEPDYLGSMSTLASSTRRLNIRVCDTHTYTHTPQYRSYITGSLVPWVTGN